MGRESPAQTALHWGEEGGGPGCETSDLAEKVKALWLGVVLGPGFWSAVILGTGKGLRQEHHVSNNEVWVLAGAWAAAQQLPEPPSLSSKGLTALVGAAVLGCALIQGLLLPVMVLISLAVPARAGTDPALEGSPPEDLAAARRGKSVTLILLGKCFTAHPVHHGLARKPVSAHPSCEWIAQGAIQPQGTECREPCSSSGLLVQRKAPAAGRKADAGLGSWSLCA